jgi:hypothetical protein
MRRSRAGQDREAVATEHRRRRRSLEPAQERARLRVLAGADAGDRIDDGRVGLGGEGREHANVRLGACVAGVDHAQRRLAARDQHQRRAHVLGLGDLGLQLPPYAQRFERGARVLAGRHARGQRQGQTAVAEQRAQVDAGFQRQRLRLAGLGCDQHQAVAEQVAAAGLVDPLALLQVIHPVQVGGHEHVGRRALLDLPRQRRAGGVGDAQRLAGLALVDHRGFVQGFLEAGGGEHGDRRGLGGGGDGAGRQGQTEGAERSEPAATRQDHGIAPGATRRA